MNDTEAPTLSTDPESTPPPPEQKVFQWDTGMPTKPDVDVLLKYWDQLKVGDIIPYDEVGVLIGCTWRTERFKTVTTTWRARLMEKGIVIECRPGKAFYVASPDDISAKTYDELLHIGRKAGRHRKKLATVVIENEVQRITLMHQGNLMRNLEREAKKARTNVLPSPTQGHQPPSVPLPQLKQPSA